MKYNVYLYSVLDQRHNACTLIQVNLDTITEFELNVEGGCSLESGRLARITVLMNYLIPYMRAITSMAAMQSITTKTLV